MNYTIESTQIQLLVTIGNLMFIDI